MHHRAKSKLCPVLTRHGKGRQSNRKKFPNKQNISMNNKKKANKEVFKCGSFQVSFKLWFLALIQGHVQNIYVTSHSHKNFSFENRRMRSHQTSSMSNRYKKGCYQISRKYPLSGYSQGMLIHTTALDQHLGGNETLK